MTQFVIGVDPGTQGGVVAISADRQIVILRKLSGQKLDDIRQIISDIQTYGDRPSYNNVSFMENVHSFPGEGVNSAHTFGRANGRLEMALECYGVPPNYIVPQVWQRGMALAKVVGDRKKAHLAKAKALFPGLKGLNLETCDAVLIAEYGWRQTFMTKNP